MRISDKVKFSKTVMKEKMDIRTAFLSAKKGTISAATTNDYAKVTYILDLSCDEAFEILLEVNLAIKMLNKRNLLNLL